MTSIMAARSGSRGALSAEMSTLIGRKCHLPQLCHCGTAFAGDAARHPDHRFEFYRCCGGFVEARGLARLVRGGGELRSMGFKRFIFHDGTCRAL